MQAVNFPSAYHCIRSVYLNEGSTFNLGIHGFYRGILPLLFTSTILRSTAFNCYHFLKASMPDFVSPQSEFARAVTFSSLSGCLTGALMSCFIAPIDFMYSLLTQQSTEAVGTN